MSDFGKRLAEQLKARKLSNADLGRSLEVSRQVIGTWVNGISEPSFEKLLKICTILACTPNDLLLGPGNNMEYLTDANGEKHTLKDMERLAKEIEDLKAEKSVLQGKYVVTVEQLAQFLSKERDKEEQD